MNATAKAVLALLKKADPKAEALLTVLNNHRAHTRFARGEITTSGENEDVSLSLTVQLGLRSSSATTNQVHPAALQALVERTLDSARLAPELPETMPVLGAQKVTPNNLVDPELSKLDAAARAKGIVAALSHSKDDLITAGYLEVNGGTLQRVSTAGLDVSAAYNDARFSVTSRTKDGTGSGWRAVSTRKRSELDFDRIGRIAAENAEKARASAQPKTIEPGRYTVVLEPAAATMLTEYFVFGLDRRALDEGRSAFVGKVGQRVANERITIRSDPRTSPMLPFDAEGLALAPHTWVKQGVLLEPFVTRFWGKKQNLAPTGNPDGFELVAGDAKREQLFAGIKRGVLISRFWYPNYIDEKTLSITALTRDGTFLIEDGQVTQPIKNFRINQSVLAALDAVDAVGDSPESTYYSDVRAPALRTHEFLLASPSDAV
ncbi:MAG: TldD/PmbA family protein [Archangium sp.]